MRKIVILVALIVLAASSVIAQDLFFTATASNQIWVASKDGSGTPSVLFDNAATSSQGPTGMVVVLDAVQKIFYGGGNHHDIFVANVDGTGTASMLWDDECCEHLGVTVDAASGVLYWTTENGGAIRRGNLDGSGVISDVFAGLASTQYPVGITIDPTAGVLYWTSVSGNSISSGNADGSSSTVLFDNANGVTGARQIVFDGVNGLLYWTQHQGGGSVGQIMVGHADGSGTPTVLFTVAEPQLPFGIDIDIASGILYWTELEYSGSSDRIMSGNADGSGTPTVLHAGDFGGVRGIAAGANLVPVELMGLSVE